MTSSACARSVRVCAPHVWLDRVRPCCGCAPRVGRVCVGARCCHLVIYQQLSRTGVLREICARDDRPLMPRPRFKACAVALTATHPHQHRCPVASTHTHQQPAHSLPAGTGCVGGATLGRAMDSHQLHSTLSLRCASSRVSPLSTVSRRFDTIVRWFLDDLTTSCNGSSAI